MSETKIKSDIEQLIAKRREQATRIADEIAALELVQEVLDGKTEITPRAASAPAVKTPKVKAKTRRVPSKGGYTLDKQAPEKTLAFLQSRKRAVTADAVAKKFRIDISAARQRLYALTRLGWVKKIGLGKFAASKKATANGAGHGTTSHALPMTTTPSIASVLL